MPTDVSFVTQASQIGKETVSGTPVPALKRLAGMGFTSSPDVTTDDFKRWGSRWPSLITPGQVESKIMGSGKPCYPDLSYILGGVHKKGTITTPGGGTNSRLHTFLQSSTDEDDVESYTIEYGSRKLARRVPGAIFAGYNFSWDTLKTALSVEGFGRKMVTGVRLSTGEIQTITKTGTVTSGTFDITGVNPLTAAAFSILLIPFDTTAGALQTLFDTAVGAGNTLVAGGPLGGTPITVEFIGNMGSQDVALMVAVSTNLVGGGTYGITTTTAGVAPAELDAFDIQPNHIIVYSDTTYGAIGTTKLARLFSGAIGIGSMRASLHVVDRDQAGAPVGHLEGDSPAGTFDMKIMANEVADTHLADLYLGATRYFRVEAIGSVIEAALTYRAVWDMACKCRSIGEYGPEGNALAQSFGWGIVHDNTFGRAISVAVQNKVTAL